MSIPPVDVPNSVRYARAELRKRIHSQRLLVDSMAVCADVLAERPECLRNARLWDVLRWCYRMDAPTVTRLLHQAAIYDLYRSVGQLSDRQMRRLCHALSNPEIVR